MAGRLKWFWVKENFDNLYTSETMWLFWLSSFLLFLLFCPHCANEICPLQVFLNVFKLCLDLNTINSFLSSFSFSMLRPFIIWFLAHKLTQPFTSDYLSTRQSCYFIAMYMCVSMCVSMCVISIWMMRQTKTLNGVRYRFSIQAVQDRLKYWSLRYTNVFMVLKLSLPR